MTLSESSAGSTPENIAGMMAKYLATSLAIENVVSEPRVISSCLPTSTISISLVGLLSRSTMLPASLAAWVPVFIATPTSAWASAGRVVGAVAGHRHEVAAGLLALDQRHLVLGRRLGEEVVDAGLVGDRRRSQRVVAGDHDGADAHRPHVVEALAHARLHGVLQPDHAEHPPRCSPPATVDDDQRRGAVLRDLLDDRAAPRAGTTPPSASTKRRTESAAPLRT